MSYLRQPKNIKTCPDCGTNLIITAKHCAVCGYRYPEEEIQQLLEASSPPKPRRFSPLLNKLLLLLGLLVALLGLSNLLVFGLQKREETRILAAAAQTTATYIATTYISPTPQPTPTNTPGPPTPTPEVVIEYTVAEGDSCLSIVTRFNIDLGSLLQKNRDLDCTLLSLGTVLEIPAPTPTPEPSLTPTP